VDDEEPVIGEKKLVTYLDAKKRFKDKIFYFTEIGREEKVDEIDVFQGTYNDLHARVSVVVGNPETKANLVADFKLDTGATVTCISDEIVNHLALIPSDVRSAKIAKGTVTVYYYIVILTFEEYEDAFEVANVDHNLSGMDVITKYWTKFLEGFLPVSFLPIVLL